MNNQSPQAKNPPEIKYEFLPDIDKEEKEEKSLVGQIKIRGAIRGMKLC